ncbi:hypothetical protein [Acidisoma cladoniae]|uniref:hypothetical protein n=1 Tax=Acidisoma cladoniae TaxID=3040935 RepID=UPI00254A1CBA|nr:hypothetical protein [Acidisoma sp. PAMC 29798]
MSGWYIKNATDVNGLVMVEVTNGTVKIVISASTGNIIRPAPSKINHKTAASVAVIGAAVEDQVGLLEISGQAVETLLKQLTI